MKSFFLVENELTSFDKEVEQEKLSRSDHTTVVLRSKQEVGMNDTVHSR